MLNRDVVTALSAATEALRIRMTTAIRRCCPSTATTGAAANDRRACKVLPLAGCLQAQINISQQILDPGVNPSVAALVVGNAKIMSRENFGKGEKSGAGLLRRCESLARYNAT